MNRYQFLSKLAAELSNLPKEEIEAAMEFYTEFLDDVGPENEAEAIKSLGDPHKVAAQIKADYEGRKIDKESEEKPYSAKRSFSAVKWALLGVFAAPVGVPVAIALGVLAIAFFIAFLALVIAAGVCVAAAVVCSILIIAIGCMAIPVTLSSALLLIGIGLMALGVTALAMTGVIIAIRAIFRKLVKRMHDTGEKRRIRKIEKEKERLKKKGGAENEQKA